MKRILFFILFACVIIATLGCIGVVIVMTVTPPAQAKHQAVVSITLPQQPHVMQSLPKMALRTIILTGSNPRILGKSISHAWGKTVHIPIHFVQEKTKVVIAAALVNITPCVSLVRYYAYPTEIMAHDEGHYNVVLKGFYENDRPVVAHNAGCVIKPYGHRKVN